MVEVLGTSSPPPLTLQVSRNGNTLDLTDVAGAQLRFSQALDIEASDSIVINTTDTIIAGDIFPLSDSNESAADWANLAPVTIPAAALGQPVRIEWCLNGTGGDLNDYMGWYIDYVSVTETTP